MNRTKIVIVGLGGVGGYFGGLLAKNYVNKSDIDVIFFARAKHLQKVKKCGLKLITDTETYQIFPSLATDNVAEIGIADYIILSTKSYDLESTAEQIKPIIGCDTIILPLLNGIDNSDRLRNLLPETEIWDGCCYIVAKINEPGVIETVGNVKKILFGYKNQKNERLLTFEKLLIDAGIEAKFYDNILTEIWKKFFFISTSASLTSYFDVSYAELLTDAYRKQTLIELSTELIQIAKAEGITIDNSEIEKLIFKFEKLPIGTTTSMHRDFLAGKNTELDGLTGIVLKLAKKHGISIPTYERVYENLKIKN